MTTTLAFRDGRLHGIPDELAPHVENIRIDFDKANGLLPYVTITLSGVDVDIENANVEIDTGGAQRWLADHLEAVDVDRLEHEATVYERTNGVTPARAVADILAAWLRRGAFGA